MIIYIDDLKYVYNDYTLQDAMNVVDEYKNDERYLGKIWKIYSLEDNLMKEGVFS